VTNGGRVVLEGAANVRDIGGFRSATGQVVSGGLVFRADALSRLSDDDVARLSAVRLRAIVDLRTPGEVLTAGPDRLPPGPTLVNLPVGGGDLSAIFDAVSSGDDERQRAALGDGRAAEFMVQMNRSFVSDGKQREQFGAVLRMMASGTLPLLYHCTGGKDRTGWLTAVLLTVLGVSREAVMQDYLRSNDYLGPSYQRLRDGLMKAGLLRDPWLLRPVMEQSPTYLNAAFDEVERLYGSFPVFVSDGLGVDAARVRMLRAALLRDA
jgi:protein-tyrosine phosphatase